MLELVYPCHQEAVVDSLAFYCRWEAGQHCIICDFSNRATVKLFFKERMVLSLKGMLNFLEAAALLFSKAYLPTLARSVSLIFLYGFLFPPLPCWGVFSITFVTSLYTWWIADNGTTDESDPFGSEGTYFITTCQESHFKTWHLQ